MDNPADTNQLPNTPTPPIPVGQLDPQTLMPATPPATTPSESSIVAQTNLEQMMPSIIPVDETPAAIPVMPDLNEVLGQIAPVTVETPAPAATPIMPVTTTTTTVTTPVATPTPTTPQPPTTAPVQGVGPSIIVPKENPDVHA